MDELALARACALGDADALRVLHDRYLSQLPGYLRRFDPEVARDAYQRFCERLLVATPARPPGIATYAGHGALMAWLRVGVTRQALNERRDQDRREQTLADDPVAEGALPELSFIRAQHRGDFDLAFVSAIASLDKRERTILKMCYVDRLSLERIGRIYGVDKSSVSRWLSEARSTLKVNTRAQLKDELRIADVTCDELVAQLEPHFDLTLSRIFS
jgi:RNA polymerase sigma-70 factor (ECF subfamily)